MTPPLDNTNPWQPQAAPAIQPVRGRQDPYREPHPEPWHPQPTEEEQELPRDRVSLSGAHLRVVGETAPPPGTAGSEQAHASDAGTKGQAETEKAENYQRAGTEPPSDAEMDSQEQAQVRELKQRDAEVKAHEQAHMAAGGGLVQGAASYTYEKGPDGAMYAVGGEVKIDTSPGRTPDQTIRKAQQIRRAALAPAQPSGTDRAVAAAASQMEAQARAEKARETDEASTEAASAGAEVEAAPTDTGAPSGPGDDQRTVPPNAFTAPGIKAYQNAAAAAPIPQAVSTFA